MAEQPVSKTCQSCGMPMRKDPHGGGTEADGARSRIYCSHGYAGGRLTSPDVTAEETQALVKAKLREMGFPGILAGMMARGVPRLRRWSAR